MSSKQFFFAWVELSACGHAASQFLLVDGPVGSASRDALGSGARYGFAHVGKLHASRFDLEGGVMEG